MVWPEDRTFVRNSNGKEIPFNVPRVRQYVSCDSRQQFTVILQSYKNDPALSISKLGKKIYDHFSEVEIYYISNRKIKIIANDIKTANNIAIDEDLNSNYMVIIPADLSEVKGVCPISSEFSEKEIFDSGRPKNLMQYGEVPSSCLITEVRRFQRKNNKDSKYDIDLVSICFSGNVLPSHICFDGINFPIKPYREPVQQCRKCWHFNHNDKMCNRRFSVCQNCGLGHDLSVQCPNSAFCINCKGAHQASARECPIYLRILKLKTDKANNMKPKPLALIQSNITFAESLKLDEINFPALGSNRHVKQNKISTKYTAANAQSSSKRARVEENTTSSNKTEIQKLPESNAQATENSFLSANETNISTFEAMITETSLPSTPVAICEDTNFLSDPINIVGEVIIPAPKNTPSPLQQTFKHTDENGKVSFIPLSNSFKPLYN